MEESTGPWLGWWTLIPLTVAMLGFALAEQLLPRLKRPEYLLGAIWLLSS